MSEVPKVRIVDRPGPFIEAEGSSDTWLNAQPVADDHIDVCVIALHHKPSTQHAFVKRDVLLSWARAIDRAFGGDK